MNKKISPIIAFLIIVLVAGIAGTAIFLFSKEVEKDFVIEEKAIRKVIDDSLLAEEKIIKEVIDDNKRDFSFEEFIIELNNKINIYCEEISINQRKYEEKYDGFYWIKENNEVELIKGHWFFTSSLHDKDLMNVCQESIMDYIKNNLIINTKNTDNKITAAFESEHIKCIFLRPYSSHFDLRCGDISKSITPKEYKEIFSYMNPSFDLSISVQVFNIIDNFADVGRGGRSGAGYRAILKKEKGEWKEIMGTQDMFECEIVFEYEVPPSLVGNACFFYETTRDTWIYNEELNEWER